MRQPQPQYVYFIEALGIDRIKIGRSNEVERRFNALRCACPVALILIGKTTLCTERDIHKKFNHLRSNGEWFFATKELRGFIDAVLNESRPFHFDLIDKTLARTKAIQVGMGRQPAQAVEA